MVRIANIAKYIALTFCLTALTILAHGQEMKEAAELYNGAATTFQQKPEQAVKDLTRCIDICTQLNTEEANDLMERAKGILPRVHFQNAKILFGKGLINESIDAMEEAKKAAEENNDPKTVKMVERTIPAIYYKQGLNEEKAKNFNKAIELCQKAIAANEKFIEPFIVVANCQDSLGLHEDMLNTLENGIEAAKRAANVPRQVDMRVMATNFLKAEADKMQKTHKHNEVIELLTKATQFDDRDALVYQSIAISQAALNKHDEVIKNADLAIECATEKMDKTQVYFLKAKALQAKGMNAEACNAYKKAAHGQFKEAAEHEMNDVLKCK